MKCTFHCREKIRGELISFLLTLPYNDIFGRETVEDNPWMDMSLSHVCKSGKSRRCKLTFRCTLQPLEPLRLRLGWWGRGLGVKKTWKTLTRSCNINEVLRCGTCKANQPLLCICRKIILYMRMRTCICKAE